MAKPPRQPAPPANRRIQAQARKKEEAAAAPLDEEALAERVAAKLDAKQQARDAERDQRNAEFQAEVLRKSAPGKKINSPCDLADYLLEEAKVAVVPGEDFGSSSHIRFSYATSVEEIEKGCARVRDAVTKLN